MFRDSGMRCGFSIYVAVSGMCLLASCATTDQTSVPATLQPADAHHTVASLAATGVQIYTCKRDPNNQLAWVFKAPQADLSDASGKLVLKHYAGPSWEAADGSKITGKVLQQMPNTKEAGSIPQLLLQATSVGGPGMLASVRYVQRLNTHGGAAPAEPCTQEGQEGRTPYRADYVFLN